MCEVYWFVCLQLSTIGRCEYEKTCTLLVQLFDEAAQRYQELLGQGQQNNINVAVQEGQSTLYSNMTIQELTEQFIDSKTTIQEVVLISKY